MFTARSVETGRAPMAIIGIFRNLTKKFTKYFA